MLTTVALALLALAPSAEGAVEADVVIRDATLHDGFGKAPIKGHLAIKGDRITGVGDFTVKGSPRIIDGKGLMIAPGFIDLHTHSDNQLPKAETRQNANYLYQGVTTVVTGNCGSGPTDVEAFFAAMDKGGVGTNVIHQVPHNSVRQAVMKNANRAPTADELKKMEEMTDKAMRDGAWGLSTGLIYNPGTYSKTDELIALAKVASKHGGHYASHIRNEGVNVLEAVEEALTIGREAKMPVHISHLKASGRAVWGKSGDIVGLIEAARKKGQVVTADQYPYPASSTSLKATLIATQFREGTEQDYQARLSDAKESQRIRQSVENSLDGKEGGKAIKIASYSKNKEWNGKDLAAIAATEKKNIIDLVMEIEKNGGAQIVNFSMSEEDVRLIMKQPWVATASDGATQIKNDAVPHPRSYGCFPRKVGRYGIEDGVVSVEHAVRSCSGLPADILKLPERGYLKVGWFSDVVVFDPEKFRDQATYDKPHQFSTGVRYLFVNGQLAIDEGKATAVLGGRVLRHKSKD
jgi:N-acyl-D-aspartate/D-glutamate deacylase